MMAQTLRTNPARRILAFDSSKKLTFIAQSQIKMAKMLGVAAPTVKAACDGNAISTRGYYLRWWNPEIEIDTINELGVLTLKEYDSLVGEERRVYEGRKMTRKSLHLKYNMKATPEKLKRLNKNNNENPES